MNKSITGNITLFFIALLFSVLLTLITDMLYTWGTPSWFNRFPYASGFRLLLSLKIFFLGCIAFFIISMFSVMLNKEYRYWIYFCISFFHIPFFSFLVMADTSLQNLRIFTGMVDFLIWLLSGFFLQYITGKDRICRYFFSSICFWKYFAFIYLFSALLSFTSVFHSLIITVFRLMILFLFSFLTFRMISSTENYDLKVFSTRYSLSPRETEVLALLLEGKKNDEIAEKLFISLSTVKTHIKAIFQKTGVRNRVEVSALCRKV